MTTNTENQPLTEATFKIYMKASSEDLVANTKVTADVAEAVNSLTDKVENLKEQTQLQQPDTAFGNDNVAFSKISKSLSEIKLLLLSRTENTTRKFQILLFPEQDSRLFYKIVFGRWLVILAIMLLLNNLYKFGVHWSDNNREIAIRQIENDRRQKAWSKLYYQSNKARKREMDKVYEEILKQQ